MKVKNSTKGETKKFLKAMTILAMPILAQDLVNASVNFIDHLMVGSLGLEAINAVGFSNQLFFLYSLVLYGMCTGSAILTGQYWGKNDVRGIHKVLGIGFLTGMVLGVTFATVAIVFPRWFLSFYTDVPEIIELGTIYLRTVGISYLITPITMTYNFALRSIKKANIPMITVTIALITSVTLNYIFIFVAGWGVFGAALGTLIARIVEITIQAIIIRKLNLPVVAKFKEYMSFSWIFAKECFRITMPVILNEAAWALGVVLCQIAYRGTGTESQGAMQINMAVANLFYIAGVAVGASSGIMIANALGAGKRVLAISYSRKALVFSVIVGIVMSSLLFVVSPFITQLYDVPDIVRLYANRLLIVTSIFMTVRMFNFTTIIGILRNGGDTKFCLFADGIVMWLVAVPMAFLGVYVFRLPIYWVFVLVLMEEVIKVVLTGFRVLGNKWANTVV